jgi:hypothetical protein
MTFVHADDADAQEPGPTGEHVVVVAPKRAAGAQQQDRTSFLDNALRRAAVAAGR